MSRNCGHCRATLRDGQRVLNDREGGKLYCSIRCAAFGLGIPGADEVPEASHFSPPAKVACACQGGDASVVCACTVGDHVIEES